MSNRYSRFSLNSLSIQKRLPLLICALLLAAIVIFGFSTYYTLKKATLAIGRERLRTLTNQLSSIYSESAQEVIKKSNNAANQGNVLQFLNSGNNAHTVRK